jgi:hypothetical protein
MTAREKSKCSRLRRRGEFEEHVDTSAHSFGYSAEEEGWQNRRSAVSSSGGSNGGAELFAGDRKNGEQRGAVGSLYAWSSEWSRGGPARACMAGAGGGATLHDDVTSAWCMHRTG